MWRFLTAGTSPTAHGFVSSWRVCPKCSNSMPSPDARVRPLGFFLLSNFPLLFHNAPLHSWRDNWNFFFVQNFLRNCHFSFHLLKLSAFFSWGTFVSFEVEGKLLFSPKSLDVFLGDNFFLHCIACFRKMSHYTWKSWTFETNLFSIFTKDVSPKTTWKLGVAERGHQTSHFGENGARHTLKNE